jgi:hypothetical protein
LSTGTAPFPTSSSLLANKAATAFPLSCTLTFVGSCNFWTCEGPG